MSLPKKQEVESPIWLERAIDLFDTDKHKDGDILSHDWLKYALDIPTAKTVEDFERIQWVLLSRVEAFKDWMLVNRSTALQSVRGKGYYVVPPNEQARFAAEEAMKHVKKGLQQADKVLTYARLADMDDDSRKRHTDTHVRLSGIGQLMKRQRKDVFALFKKPEQLTAE
jgi:hypothetical protein